MSDGRKPSCGATKRLKNCALDLVCAHARATHTHKNKTQSQKNKMQPHLGRCDFVVCCEQKLDVAPTDERVGNAEFGATAEHQRLVGGDDERRWRHSRRHATALVRRVAHETQRERGLLRHVIASARLRLCVSTHDASVFQLG